MESDWFRLVSRGFCNFQLAKNGFEMVSALSAWLKMVSVLFQNGFAWFLESSAKTFFFSSLILQLLLHVVLVRRRREHMFSLAFWSV